MATAPTKDGINMKKSPATARAVPQASIEELVVQDVPAEASQISRDVEEEKSESSRNHQVNFQVDHAAVMCLKDARLHLVTIA
jgi:hypothetical protein